ncbi:tetratricopeptide repeat protein 1 [Scaptodrosophila lebanonensis]|uniref:Tetratricopeptide repeat protein 1 n=1 Tax=Drosophila lebanonensis TaxID=7225 RepID=A0A6J2TM26_DROLE|nr:tetratricopeptide repeat protein 1 [Scaptodrosophila lebanonensis]
MSQAQGKNHSDDEFQDALSEPPLASVTKTSTLNEQIIEEIVEKQSNLKLNDDAVKIEADDELGAAGGSGDGENNETDSSDKKTESPIDVELSIEELRELQKDWTSEEVEQNKEKANQLKLEGNELFKNDDPERAIKIYTEALNICPADSSKERAVLYGNRAAAKIKLEARKSAISDCCKAIELWPEYVRALLRRAKLYEQEERPDEALEDYKRVYEIDPGQPDAREAQIRLPPIINARNEKLKTEMMSSLKDLGNMILKPFGLSTTNFQMKQDPNSGSYSINFNQ